MLLKETTQYAIMSKDRKFIVKGNKTSTYDKTLVAVDDVKDKKSILLYTKAGSAKNAMLGSIIGALNLLDGYQYYIDAKNPASSREDFLEVVEVKVIIELIN